MRQWRVSENQPEWPPFNSTIPSYLQLPKNIYPIYKWTEYTHRAHTRGRLLIWRHILWRTPCGISLYATVVFGFGLVSLKRSQNKGLYSQQYKRLRSNLVLIFETFIAKISACLTTDTCLWCIKIQIIYITDFTSLPFSNN